MPKVFGKDVRKVIQVGKALAITLPANYVKTNDIKLGDLIELEYNRKFHGQPVDLKEIQRRLDERQRFQPKQK
jgi:antitoxin component of MazEF toxin-antitoxin module